MYKCVYVFDGVGGDVESMDNKSYVKTEDVTTLHHGYDNSDQQQQQQMMMVRISRGLNTCTSLRARTHACMHAFMHACT